MYTDIFENKLIDVIKNNEASFALCEKIRKNKLKDYLFDVIFVIILTLVLCKFLSLPMFLALFIIPVGSIHFLIHKITEYQMECKKYCFPFIAELAGLKSFKSGIISNVNYDKTLQNSKLFKNFNYYSLNNFFKAQYNSIEYELSEITLSTSTGGYGIFFQGLIITYPFKYSKEHIIITTKADRIAPKAKKIKILHPEYNRIFNIYSVNREMKERELLASIPSYIFNSLIDLQRKYSAKKVKCAIFEDKIMIAISLNRYLFQTGNLFKSCIDIESKLSLVKDIQPIIDLIRFLYFKSDSQC